MTFRVGQQDRRSLRLPEYDYSGPGAYFLTLCLQDRECLFGDVVNADMYLNRLGRIAWEEWVRSAELRPGIALDVFVVMPNHLHGIVLFNPTPDDKAKVAGYPDPVVGAHSCAPLQCHAPLQRPRRSLGSFVAGFKSTVTKRVNQVRGTPGRPLWQRNYFEHIIRTERALVPIREYILSNPQHWTLDIENPSRVREHFR